MYILLLLAKMPVALQGEKKKISNINRKQGQDVTYLKATIYFMMITWRASCASPVPNGIYGWCRCGVVLDDV
jgi:hypothetical protein